MKRSLLVFLIPEILLIPIVLIILGSCSNQNSSGFGSDDTISFWLTDCVNNTLFIRQTESVTWQTSEATDNVIKVNPEVTYQNIDGFGYTLTGGSAILLNQMNPEARKIILEELFGFNEKSIGVSYLRLSLGASDLSDHLFSYDDMPSGRTDPELTNFSLDAERKDLIPVIREILKINPELKILASPWSAPAWMKTNNNAKGGSLKTGYFDAYARYFVRYIKEMKDAGISIDAITVQNEPLHPGNNPSMFMTPEDQAKFVKNHLGPLFEKEKIETKIIIYDHNADRTDYPMSILADTGASKYIDGSAFHLYGGKIEALSEVHTTYPTKNIYFTEQWVGGPADFAGEMKWHTENLIIGATRNWCRTVLEWNLASDPKMEIHTDDGGCTNCLGAITIDKDNISRNPAYYIIAHASKFVRPGSVRIESNIPASLPNVAFQTPEGKVVLLVLNSGQSVRTFSINYRKQHFESKLESGAVATYVW